MKDKLYYFWFNKQQMDLILKHNRAVNPQWEHFTRFNHLRTEDTREFIYDLIDRNIDIIIPQKILELKKS